jgi:16S rRNA (cytosine1402-N4)-methyltransferase
MKQIHIPVLLNEVLENLIIKSNKNYIDATVGLGGHAKEILKLNGPNGKVLGIDLDKDALRHSKNNLKNFGSRILLVCDSYINIDKIVKEKNFKNISGILLDLGLSSLQLDKSERGFSFNKDEPLDMRFSKDQELNAHEIINTYQEKDLREIFSKYGQEPQAYRISKRICNARKEREIKTTKELVNIIRNSVHKSRVHKRKHFATQVFMALRIAVNNEFSNIEKVLQKAISILDKKGRLAVISFHSLEDRIVKDFIKQESRDCICPANFPKCVCNHNAKVKLINKKAIKAGPEEIQTNPRSRSAQLRVVEKI